MGDHQVLTIILHFLWQIDIPPHPNRVSRCVLCCTPGMLLPLLCASSSQCIAWWTMRRFFFLTP
jgi:hypothetical protein